ncbi:MAG: PEP-CTERM sorting domain-containing protein [Planctomycetota bacterium]|nr:PEP-CTERM sorting domain-containing protein [Planctomycetota bacterium]
MKIASAIVLAALAAATPALADTITKSASFKGKTDVDTILKLDQFDASLGTLTGVTLEVSAGVIGEFNFTNISGGRKRFFINWLDWQVDVTGFGGPKGNLINSPFVVAPTADNPYGGAPGRFNYTSPTLINVGQTITPIPYGEVEQATFNYTNLNTEFSQFIGSGQLDFRAEIPVLFSVAVSGSGQSKWSLDTQGVVNITATYTYTIPAPASLGVLSLAGLALGRRRR